MIACMPEKTQAQLILEELALENDRLREALLGMIAACDNCGGTGVAYEMDETEVGQAPGSSAHACVLCTDARLAMGMRVHLNRI